MSENVLCVKAEALERIWPGPAYKRWIEPRVGSLRHLIRLVSLPPDMFACGVRPDCEQDEGLKQLVTYTSIICGDDILTYRRGSKGDEGRLHAKRSVGIGGHVVCTKGNLIYGPSTHYFETEAEREICEELGESEHYEGDFIRDNFLALYPTGLIYDPSDSVGRVHLGVTFALYLSSRDGIGANCPSIEDVRWERPDDLQETVFGHSVEEYESWSRLVLRSSLI